MDAMAPECLCYRRLVMLDTGALNHTAPYNHLVHVFLILILELVAGGHTNMLVAHLVAVPALVVPALVASKVNVVVLLALDKLAQ